MGVLSSESIGKVGESPAQGLVNKCVFVVAVIVRRSSGGQAGFWGGRGLEEKQIRFGTSSLDPLLFVSLITTIVQCNSLLRTSYMFRDCGFCPQGACSISCQPKCS